MEKIESPNIEIIIDEHGVLELKNADKYSDFLNRPPVELLDDKDFIIPLPNNNVPGKKNT